MQVKSRVRGAAAVIVVIASVGVGALSQAGPAAAARATPAGPGGTWGQALAVPGVSALGTGGTQATDGYATAISCTSPGECIAVGSYSAATTWPLVVSQSDGAWGQAEALPGIAALSSGLGGKLTQVSCASAGNCSAAGTYTGPGNTSFAFVADEVDGTWGTAQALPDAASLGTQGSAISAISCPSAGNCAAVGADYATPFILDEVDGTWGDPLAVPGLASLGTLANQGFDSVSCADAGDCTAIGTVANGSGVQSAVVVTETGGTWGDATVLPGQVPTSSRGSWARSVSCPAAGDCTATGGDEPVGNTYGVWVADEVNGSWGSAQALPTPLATTTDATGKLSCATPGNCVVAGGYRDAQGFLQAFVADEVNGTWQASQDVPGLAGMVVSDTDAVSCAAPGDCTSTGSYDINGHYQEYSTDEVDGTWAPATAIPGAPPGGPTIDGLSCTAPGYCSAVGVLYGQRSLVSEATGTVTTITAAANDGSADEQSAPVTVSVTSLAGGTPTGTVTVTSDPLQPTAPACTVTLSGGTGSCAFPTTGLDPESYQLAAIYNGDTTYAASASAATASLTVTGIGFEGSSPGIAGRSLTLNGRLEPPGSLDGPPAGTVINIARTLAGSTSTVSSTATTDAYGDFTITDTPPTAGTYTYTATYVSDNPDIASSTGSVIVTVSPAPTRTYSGTIRLPKMGLCLDDRNNSASDGAVVQVWKCTGSANQDWQVYSDGTIRHNGLCLDAAGYGTANGTKVQLWACNVSANQKWDTRDWRIHYDNPAADDEVLDDTGHGGNGTQQQIWTNLNGTNQYWATS